MPKNKNKPNAFLFFMLEWKKKEEKKGRRFPNGMKDVQTDPECNEEWRKMSDEDKSYYKSMAKNDKTHPNVKAKRTGQGELLSDIDYKNMKEQEFQDTMKEYIYALINEAKNSKSIHCLKFHVIHINFFYSRPLETNENEYYPAEISIVEFTLEHGILRKYHQIINEKIKLGYSSAAKIHSNETHQIPLNAEFGKSDYREIFNDICKFLEPAKEGTKLPVLYTFFLKEDVYLPVKFVLEQLGQSDDKYNGFLRLYSLEYLFSTIHNTVESYNQLPMDETRAKLELGKDPFIYKSGLECEYHGLHKAGSIFCSQSIAIRWIYVIYKFCNTRMKIAYIPGKHYPQDNLDSNLDIESIQSSFKTLNLNSSRHNSSYSLNSTVNSERYGRSSRERSSSKTDNTFKPIEIIDHSKTSKIFKVPSEEVLEVPLRVPKTTSAARSLELNDNNFPSIGRGKKK